MHVPDAATKRGKLAALVASRPLPLGAGKRTHTCHPESNPPGPILVAHLSTACGSSGRKKHGGGGTRTRLPTVPGSQAGAADARGRAGKPVNPLRTGPERYGFAQPTPRLVAVWDHCPRMGPPRCSPRCTRPQHCWRPGRRARRLLSRPGCLAAAQGTPGQDARGGRRHPDNGNHEGGGPCQGSGGHHTGPSGHIHAHGCPGDRDHQASPAAAEIGLVPSGTALGEEADGWNGLKGFSPSRQMVPPAGWLG